MKHYHILSYSDLLTPKECKSEKYNVNIRCVYPTLHK